MNILARVISYRVKHDNREKGAALGNSAVETLARDLLREMAEEGNA